MLERYQLLPDEGGMLPKIVTSSFDEIKAHFKKHKRVDIAVVHTFTSLVDDPIDELESFLRPQLDGKKFPHHGEELPITVCRSMIAKYQKVTPEEDLKITLGIRPGNKYQVLNDMLAQTIFKYMTARNILPQFERLIKSMRRVPQEGGNASGAVLNPGDPKIFFKRLFPDTQIPQEASGKGLSLREMRLIFPWIPNLILKDTVSRSGSASQNVNFYTLQTNIRFRRKQREELRARYGKNVSKERMLASALALLGIKQETTVEKNKGQLTSAEAQRLIVYLAIEGYVYYNRQSPNKKIELQKVTLPEDFVLSDEIKNWILYGTPLLPVEASTKEAPPTA